MAGKAQKRYLNKVAKETERLLKLNRIKKQIEEMKDDLTYTNEQYNLTLTGKEWKELITTQQEK